MPGDFDGDRDVNQEDSGHFQVCCFGPGMLAEAGCENAVLDMAGDVDENDFAVLMSCLSGADNPADPYCAS